MLFMLLLLYQAKSIFFTSDKLFIARQPCVILQMFSYFSYYAEFSLAHRPMAREINSKI